MCTPSQGQNSRKNCSQGRAECTLEYYTPPTTNTGIHPIPPQMPPLSGYMPKFSKTLETKDQPTHLTTDMDGCQGQSHQRTQILLSHCLQGPLPHFLAPA